MKTVNIDIDKHILGSFATDGTYWLKDHCIEKENHMQNGILNVYFRFGEDDSSTENRTNNFNISRADARNFIVCFLDARWGVDAEYHIDSLWFSSDGDEDDCQYVIKAEIYKRN